MLRWQQKLLGYIEISLTFLFLIRHQMDPLTKKRKSKKCRKKLGWPKRKNNLRKSSKKFKNLKRKKKKNKKKEINYFKVNLKKKNIMNQEHQNLRWFLERKRSTHIHISQVEIQLLGLWIIIIKNQILLKRHCIKLTLVLDY